MILDTKLPTLSVRALWMITFSIFLLDIFTPVRYAAWVFYILPLFLSISVSKRQILYMGGVITVLLVAGMFFSPQFLVPPPISIFNRATGTLVFWMMIFLIIKRADAVNEVIESHKLLEERVKERTRDLEDAKNSLQNNLQGRISEIEDLTKILFDSEVKISELQKKLKGRPALD